MKSEEIKKSITENMHNYLSNLIMNGISDNTNLTYTNDGNSDPITIEEIKNNIKEFERNCEAYKFIEAINNGAVIVGKEKLISKFIESSTPKMDKEFKNITNNKDFFKAYDLDFNERVLYYRFNESTPEYLMLAIDFRVSRKIHGIQPIYL